MKIITNMLEDEVYEASNGSGHSVTIDMREASIKKNQSPVELLLSSLSACGAVDIVLILKKRRKTIQDFRVETTGIRREDTPRRFTDIHCKYIITSPDVTEEELDKVAALSLEKYCSVAATLNCKITYSVELISN
ncbi:OsmC family protein [Oscillatoria amoena NRMC-F 0135]|nr:OsmC family protein [Oscillatoria amoena NRMC-F 0135]